MHIHFIHLIVSWGQLHCKLTITLLYRGHQEDTILYFQLYYVLKVEIEMYKGEEHVQCIY